MSGRASDLARIEQALARARATLAGVSFETLVPRFKRRGDPVTDADCALDEALRASLPAAGEGWLSEESPDDPQRLECARVWIVDPLDGTREFLAGVPEWSVCIALVERGEAVAGGVWNPATDEAVVGAVGHGVRLNGEPCRMRARQDLAGAEVLASRSEVRRGDWDRFHGAPFRVRAMGSAGYKLAQLAQGAADATWTFVRKSEWDVAAGVALVLAAGGSAWLPDGSAPRFNRPDPRIPGLVASTAALAPALRRYLES